MIQKVDGSRVVAPERAPRVVRARRQEDDRHVPRPLRAAHELPELEAVHVGHLHVEQGEGDVVDQEQLQGFASGPGPQQLEPVPTEQRLEGEQVLVEVVDQEQLDRTERVHEAGPRARRAASMFARQSTRALGTPARAAFGISLVSASPGS